MVSENHRGGPESRHRLSESRGCLCATREEAGSQAGFPEISGASAQFQSGARCNGKVEKPAIAPISRESSRDHLQTPQGRNIVSRFPLVSHSLFPRSAACGEIKPTS